MACLKGILIMLSKRKCQTPGISKINCKYCNNNFLLIKIFVIIKGTDNIEEGV